MKKTKIIQLLLLITTVALTFSSCTDDDYADWKILNEKWMENKVEILKRDSGYIETESGLLYKVIHQGTMRRPNSSSWVVVDYSGTLIDGTEFDSGEYSYYLSYTIDGWQEAIPKMNGGGKYIIYVPWDLAYGEDGSGDDIPPYSVLRFVVELVDSYY